jgi:hypothetical protein
MSADNKPTPLVLGGIEIVPHSGTIRQRYEPIGGSTTFRLSRGTGIKQTHWQRTATSVGGTGYLDPGLFALDYSEPLELLCVQPRSMEGVTPVFTLPPAASRRPNDSPTGWARVGDIWIDTPLQLDGDVAHLGAVAGAAGYRVFWLPRLVVFTDGIACEFDNGTGMYDWSFEAQEV